ncbi:MAG: hypothetical protein JWN93_2229 [Hyphomicrobiales bacterium]|nr:hypothetical protein [Hyphomicrobiales bacterium]
MKPVPAARAAMLAILMVLTAAAPAAAQTDFRPAFGAGAGSGLLAPNLPPGPGSPTPPAPETPPEPAPEARAPDIGALALSANFGADDKRIAAGLTWRVFRDAPDGDGKRPLAAESTSATPIFVLPFGDYVVHAAYGLASAVRRVSITGPRHTERLALNAGGLRVLGMLGEARIAPERLSISVFVPEGANPQGKLVARDVRPGRLLRLPEGTYHLISTYLDAPSAGGAGGSTNSVVDADVRIQPGRTTETTLRHRAALMTLKLVNAPGGEALANTSFTILTPGGDVIREMIGAFPSLVLAEGEYVAIARRDGRTYQGAFTVRSARDRDVEILAREPQKP